MQPKPCAVCGSLPELAENPSTPGQWRAVCPNRNVIKGRKVIARSKRCGGTPYRESRESAVARWNLEQDGVERMARKKRRFSTNPCPKGCGLRGEHVCLYAEGFVRLGAMSCVSLHPRMS